MWPRFPCTKKTSIFNGISPAKSNAEMSKLSTIKSITKHKQRCERNSPSASRRFILSFAGWTLGIILLASWNISQEYKMVFIQAKAQADESFKKDLAYRRWATSHGGVYVQTNDQTRPNPALANIKERDITTPSGKPLTLINPAYMSRLVLESSATSNSIQSHITSLNPINCHNSPDAWEEQALTQLENGASEIHSRALINGQPHFRFIKPFLTEKNCLTCHAKQGYKIGDIRGGISISVPLSKFHKTWENNARSLAGGHFLLWIIGTTGLYLFERIIRHRESDKQKADEQLLRYQHIVSCSNDMLALLAPDGTYLAVNKTYAQLFCMSPEALTGKTIFNTLDPNMDSSRVQARMNQCLKGNEVRFQIWKEFTNKGKRYFDVSYSPQQSSLNETTGVIISMRDITTVRETEETLQKLVETSSHKSGISFFRTLSLELATALKADYIIIGKLEPDPKRTIQTIVVVSGNEIRPNFNYELAGTPCEHVVRGKANIYVEKVAEKFPKDVLLEKMGLEGYVGVPLFDKNNTPLGIAIALYQKPVERAEFVATILQVFANRIASETERIASENELKQQEQQYHSMLDSSIDGFLISDARGNILDTNRSLCTMLCYDEKELTSITLKDLEAKQTPVHLAKHIERIMTHGPNRVETQLKQKDGTTIEVEISTTYLPLFDGRFFSFIRDITAQKQLESQFRQAQKMEAVGQLAGGVAHDFNNVLQAIMGHTELAMLDTNLDELLRTDLSEIFRAGKRAAKLVRQLLAFSRQQSLHLESLAIEKEILNFLSLIERLIGENIILKFHADKNIHTINADSGQIEQVLMNLFINARDAMQDGGIIAVDLSNITLDETFCIENEWATPKPYIKISIKDNGCGMSPAIKDHIFDPFFTTKEIGKGTGLGLATAYGIIRHHGGMILVESTPDIGTEFIIYLPALTDSNAQKPESEIIDTVEPNGCGTILFAEDDETVRILTARILKEAGYTVLIAQNGEEALELYSTAHQTIDLVFLDVIMPKLNGYEVFNYIRRHQPDMQTLFASGYNETTTEFYSPENGVELLKKPYRRNELLQAVRKTLNTPNLMQAN